MIHSHAETVTTVHHGHSSDSDSGDECHPGVTFNQSHLTGITLSGYLRKQSPAMFHKWQKRYFVFLLEEQALVYFKNMRHAKLNKRKGAIRIADITGVQGRPGDEFEIATHERTYFLQAYDQHAKTVWVDSLRAIKEIFCQASLRHLDGEQLHREIEEGLKNLCMREGKIIVANHDLHHGDRAFDIHGEEVHGKIIDARAGHGCHAMTDDVIVQKDHVTRHGDCIVEEQNTTTFTHIDPVSTITTTEIGVVPCSTMQYESYYDKSIGTTHVDYAHGTLNKDFVYVNQEAPISQNTYYEKTTEIRTDTHPVRPAHFP